VLAVAEGDEIEKAGAEIFNGAVREDEVLKAPNAGRRPGANVGKGANLLKLVPIGLVSGGRDDNTEEAEEPGVFDEDEEELEILDKDEQRDAEEEARAETSTLGVLPSLDALLSCAAEDLELGRMDGFSGADCGADVPQKLVKSSSTCMSSISSISSSCAVWRGPFGAKFVMGGKPASDANASD